MKVLKALFKVVIDDIYYEIDGLYTYVKYLESQKKRLVKINNYKFKMDTSKSEIKRELYLNKIRDLLSTDETLDNYNTILEEYEHAIVIREDRIEKLYKEITILKSLQK